MITKNTDTEFDRLIQARLRNNQMRNAQLPDETKPKYTGSAPRHPNFHRNNYRPDPKPIGRPRSANFDGFFARAGGSPSQELAESKFTLDPAPSSSANEPAGKRYQHQGKTYKEEPIGKK